MLECTFAYSHSRNKIITCSEVANDKPARNELVSKDIKLSKKNRRTKAACALHWLRKKGRKKIKDTLPVVCESEKWSHFCTCVD